MSIVLTASTKSRGNDRARAFSFHTLSGFKFGSAFLLALLFISTHTISFSQQLSVNGGGFRTAGYLNWANSVNSAGKRMAVKRKADKVNFKISLSVASSSNVLLVEFGMNVKGAITRGNAKTDTLAVIDGKKITTTLSTVNPGDSIQIDGVGDKGKLMALKYKWGTDKAQSVKDPAMYKMNKVGLPMPNLINVGEELFPKGFGQINPYFANGLLIGVPQGPKGGNSVLMKKYSDVLASMVSKTMYHSGTPRCLDSLGKKLFSKQVNSLSPKVTSNSLFAQALTLKLNIAASATQKFPVGFGELLYNVDIADPLYGLTLNQISAVTDTILSCMTPTTIDPISYDLLTTDLYFINTFYTDSPYSIDTLSFGSKTQLSGYVLSGKTSKLIVDPNIKPVVWNDGENLSNTTPSAFALHQNYPNPFNPTTQLSFSLSQSSLVTLKVYNMLGQEVVTLIDKEQYDGGEYDVPFDASNLTSGIYFYRLNVQTVNEQGITRTFTDVKKMTLVK